jgi:protein-S-isoprenylcysteine O-methyltransferase Ste14
MKRQFLVFYIFSPVFNYPNLVPISRHMFGSFGMIAGTWLTLSGIMLVILGWRKIHRSEGLVADGIYRYIRHPQYLGLFLIIYANRLSLQGNWFEVLQSSSLTHLSG